MCGVSQAKARGWCETTVCVLFVICTAKIISSKLSTVLDNCAWAVSNVHVDLPTLANWCLCNVYARERLSPRLTSSLYISFFSQFLLPPFIACIEHELVSLVSEAMR